MRSYKEEKTLPSALDATLNLIDKTKSEIKISLVDSKSGDRLTYPARMKKCKHIEAFDFTTFAVLFGQAYIDQKPEIRCPHQGCGVVLKDDDFEDISEGACSDHIIVDAFILKALLSMDTLEVLYIPVEDKFIDPNDIDYFKGIILKKDAIDNQPTKNFRLVDLICQLTKEKTKDPVVMTRMKDPIVSNKCKHMACMDLDAYFKWKPDECCKCKTKLEFNDLHVDAIVKKVLAHKPACDIPEYNVAADKIVEEEKMEQSPIHDSLINPGANFKPSSGSGGGIQILSSTSNTQTGTMGFTNTTGNLGLSTTSKLKILSVTQTNPSLTNTLINTQTPMIDLTTTQHIPPVQSKSKIRVLGVTPTPK